MRRCPQGGFRGVESEFEVKNDVGQPPGLEIDEFIKLQNLKKLQKLFFYFVFFFFLFFFKSVHRVNSEPRSQTGTRIGGNESYGSPGAVSTA